MKVLSLLVCATSLYSLDLASATPTPHVRRGGLPSTSQSKHLRPVLERRADPGFSQGQPYDGKGKGAPISGEVLSGHQDDS